MLLPLDERERIRRAYHIERKSIRQIARETGHCRDAIRRAIDESPPATTVSQYPESRPSPIFGPFQSRIDALLVQNDQLPRKQRYTSHKLFEIIQAEGYDGCESRVRQYIGAWKQAHHQPEVFLPLEFEHGQDGQYTELCGKSESGILKLELSFQSKEPGGYQWLTNRTISKWEMEVKSRLRRCCTSGCGKQSV